MWFRKNMLLVDSLFMQGMQKRMSVTHVITKSSHGKTTNLELFRI